MTKKQTIAKIKKEIIKILKEGEWKSEYQTYSEIADYIICDALKILK